MATYYVSPTGNDFNAGTSTGTAWRTLAHSVSELVAGDTLNLMDGVYSGEKFLVNKSGTSGSPITIQAYAGATPIIDGGWTYGQMVDYTKTVVRGRHANLVEIGVLSGSTRVGGDYIIFDGIHIRNSQGRGMIVIGHHTTVQNCKIYQCFQTGVLIWPDSEASNPNRDAYTTVTNCEITLCSDGWHTKYQRQKYSVDGVNITNWPPPIFTKQSKYVTISDNIIHDNGGEGIGIHGAWATTVEGNECYNNGVYNIYVDWAGSGALIRNNICYNTPNYVRDPQSTSVPGRGGLPGGIAFHDEVGAGYKVHLTVGGVDGYTQNLQCYNNLIVNCENGIWIFGKANLVNCRFEHNTVVDCVRPIKIHALTSPTPEGQIRRWSNTKIRNNIFFGVGIVEGTPTGISFGNNLWSTRPTDSDQRGTGDVYANPALVDDDPSYTGGTLDATDYHLTGSSPAIGAAIGALQNYDYRGADRDGVTPDMGFMEYGGEVTPVLSAGFTLSASTIAPGDTVTITSTASMTSGTIDTWAYHWTLDNATWTSIGTSEDETFTPSVSGDYIIRQTVTDTDTSTTKYYTLALTVTAGTSEEEGGPVIPVATNLLTNSTFDTATTGWSKSGTGSWSVVDGRLKLTSTSALYIYQTIGPVTSGEQYIVAFDSELTGQTGYENDRTVELSIIQHGSPYAHLIDLEAYTIVQGAGVMSYYNIITIDTSDSNARFRIKIPYIYPTSGASAQAIYLDNIVVSPYVEIIAGFSTSDTTPDLDDVVTFTDSSTNASSWLWEIEDGDGEYVTFSTVQNPTYTFIDSGVYTVRQTVTNADTGETDTATESITVEEDMDYYQTRLRPGMRRGLP